MLQLITALLGLGGQSIATWQERKKIESEKKLEIAKIEAMGKVEAAKALAQAEASYDNLAQQQMSNTWKDEYLVLILTAPFLLSFSAPFIHLFFKIDLTQQIAEAWRIVGTAPDWYQYSFWGIIVATFGLRWAVTTFKGKLINAR